MLKSGPYSVGVVVDGVELEARIDGSFLLPFDAEYAIIFKNEDTKRACVKVSIDGVSVTGDGPDDGLVIPRNDWRGAPGVARLERPVTDACKNKFKFVSAESRAAAVAGKSGADTDGSKGTLRVEFFAEKLPQYQPVLAKTGVARGGGCFPSEYPKATLGASAVSFRGGGGYATNSNLPVADYERPRSISAEPKTGVTVEGSASDQKFYTVDMEVELRSTVIIAKLVGYARRAALPVKQTAKYCWYCGTPVSPLSNNCTQCGKGIR